MNPPPSFICCICSECPKADTCLRRMAFAEMNSQRAEITIVNPAFKNVSTDQCEYYRSIQPLRCGKGMKHLLDNVPARVYQSIKSNLIYHFTRTRYYAMVKGNSLVRPDDQAYIANVFSQNGVEQTPEYDDYVYDYNWGNIY
ncbi:MAG: hypothetical protein IKI05_02855 [Bacteroidaceae bacterium]|nr:hypothetical protein [Bacteroidaceae bacterium]